VTQPPARKDSNVLSYILASLGILTSLSLGAATLMFGIPQVEPDVQGPSVSIEELDPGKSTDTPNNAGTPGFDPKQAQLVASLDEGLYAAVAKIAPGTAPHDVTIPGELPTVVLPSRSTPYDLSSLTSAGAITKQSDGTLLMQKSVLVGTGAQLRLTAPGSTLRMSSGPQGFATLIAFKGTMVLEGNDGQPLSITSWDPTKNAPDTEPSDGRAFIRSVGGRMDLRAVNTTDLGFWSGRTGGVAWTGSAAEPATGSARGIKFTGNHYGLFSDRTKGLLVNGAEITNSVMDGVAVNHDSTGTELWNVTSSQNQRNGIAVARGANNISMRSVKATGNTRNGIFVDGTPPAQGPNAGGGTTAHATGFTVDGSTVSGNAEHGILINGADKAELTRNTVTANQDGIIVRGVTQGTALRENRISSPGGFAVAIRDGSTDAVVDKNIISNAVTAVQVDNAIGKISGNEISGMTMHAVSIIGNANGSSIVDNRWAGRGPSAIDLTRIGAGSLVDISGNDESGWIVDKDNVKYLISFVTNHPLILLWCLILVFPLAGRIYFSRRRKRMAPGQHPYKAVAAVSSTSTSGSGSGSAARTSSAARTPSAPGGAARRGQAAGTGSARDGRPGRDGTPVALPRRSSRAGGPAGREPLAGKPGAAPLKPVSWSGPGPRQPGESRPGSAAGQRPASSRQPSGRQSVPGKPSAPGKPSVPGKPSAPGKPSVPGKPSTPGKPSAPGKPFGAGSSSAPGKPGAPGGQGRPGSGRPPHANQQRPGNQEPPGKQSDPRSRQASGQQAGPAKPPGGRAQPGSAGQQPGAAGRAGSGQQPGPTQGQRPHGQNRQGPNNKRPPQGGTKVTVVSPE
jgi:parallel beta helix pectate lyase-like protein